MPDIEVVGEAAITQAAGAQPDVILFDWFQRYLRLGCGSLRVSLHINQLGPNVALCL